MTKSMRPLFVLGKFVSEAEKFQSIRSNTHADLSGLQGAAQANGREQGSLEDIGRPMKGSGL